MIITNNLKCADCGKTIKIPPEPKGGWELEDDRIVCSKCCANDLRIFALNIIGYNFDPQ